MGHTIEGSYTTYTDPRGFSEGDSTAIWRRADDIDFTTNVEIIKIEPISQSVISNYTLTEADNNKYIQFSVIPRSTAQDFNEGFESSIILQDKIRMPQTVPIVTLKRPYNNTRFYAGNDVIMSAEAICDDTTITKIEYYANGLLIANSSEFPYTASWNISKTGNYSIFAKAYNALGESADSEVVLIEAIDKPQIVDEFDELREK